jgi:hypothetical protein
VTAQLASWNDRPTRAAIVDFVERVTAEGGPDFVPPSERIATFDNDGTLWCEKPLSAQARFSLLVQHDDAEREFAYTSGAEKSLEAAAAHGWTMVSIKNDWATVFA